VSSIRRAIWDGDNEADEIQMPADDTDGAAILENDTGPVDKQNHGTGSWDTNAFFGRVAYTRGLVADEPLSITRTNYRNGWYTPTVFDFPPFALLPFWNTRGVIDGARFGGGTYNSSLTGRREYCLVAATPTQYCVPTDCASSLNRCVGFTISNAFFAYDRPRIEIRTWQGSLGQDKKDGAGTLYRRNRVYDPASGRFTQEDPIGLAGGLNLYGFANSNPLNYSDPFGLCVGPLGSICARIAVFLLGRAAPFIASAAAAMTGLSGGQTQASNARAGATIDRLTATFEGNMDKLDGLHLDAAAREAAGEAVAWKESAGRAYDHLTEVRGAMQGLRNVISGVNRLLKNGRPTDAQRQAAEALRQQAIDALKKAQDAGITRQ
jgi:RHS repeat-associated protein